VLGDADGLSSLAASMCTAMELLEGRIDVAAANGVHWGSHSTLITVVLHFPELKTELEVLGSRCSTDMTEDEVDALWIRVLVASDLLAPHIASSVAHNPPYGTREQWWLHVYLILLLLCKYEGSG
jgi:hypothetical protein